MDEKEYALFRERTRALARKILLDELATYVGNLHTQLQALEPLAPWSANAILQERFLGMREKYAKELAIPRVGPEYSDLLSAEFQEAFDEVCKEVEAIILKGP
jgi:hypothetical protein